MHSDIHHQERKHGEYVWSLVLAWYKPENVLLLREVDCCSFQVHGSQHSGSSSEQKTWVTLTDIRVQHHFELWHLQVSIVTDTGCSE